MRCLPISKLAIAAEGHILHDWHAEIVAIRAFNHYLLQEAHALASFPDFKSTILRHRTKDEILSGSIKQPFIIQDEIRIMMYCSEAPCGDASMEIVMESQEDATPWPVAVTADDTPTLLLGRGSFSQLGVVRRKPGKSMYPCHEV